MNINNDGMYSKAKALCPGCNLPLNVRMVLHNVPENCKECITFPYMKIGESMHFECYLEKSIKEILKKGLKDINAPSNDIDN